MDKCYCHRFIVEKFVFAFSSLFIRGPNMFHGRTRSIAVSRLPQLVYRAMAGRCVVHESCGDRIFRDYWPASKISVNISTKEILHLKAKVVKLLMRRLQLIKIILCFN